MMNYARYGQIRSQGMTNYNRNTPEEYTVWTDDMFMGIPFLMQAGLYAGSPEVREIFFNDAANQILDFNKHVWDADAKLYMHASYTSRPEVKLPHWSRANGWAIWAISEVLMYLPEKHPAYLQILKHFKTFAETLISYQAQSGFWYNVLDRDDSPEEVSGTAIFTMAMARGVRYGWLDKKKYMPVVINGWKAIASEIENDGTVAKICVGTMCSEDENYYINRPFYNNDTHGSFAVIFAGIEVQRMFDELEISNQRCIK
jgi:rhamnogalacturonyl hydrolase YesR